MLRRQPGFTAVAVLTLALGTGAATAIFSIVDATMLRPLPYPDPEQLVEINPEVVRPDGRVSSPTASWRDMQLWATATDTVSLVAGWGGAFRGRIVDGPQPERIRVLHVTEGYLPMHGVTPIEGRQFTAADMQHGAPAVAMVGYGYWQSRFGARREVIGETLRLDDGAVTIIGVLPDWFDSTTPLVTPLIVPPAEVAQRGTGRVSVFARLRPGITIERAADRLTSLMAAAASDDPALAGRAVVTSRLDAEADGARPTVRVLAGAVGFILLIGCVNVAGLLLARGAVRRSELAVRASLGAGRLRLIRQVLTESLVLSVAGGAVGILLAWLSLDLIVANLPIWLPSTPIRLNTGVLAASFALLIPTTLVFGLAPALSLSNAHLTPSLARGGRHPGTSLSRRSGQVLIAVEVAMAVVLVAGAGLMIRSFQRLSGVELGFNPDRLVTMQVLPLDSDPQVHRRYFPALLKEIAALDGVASVGGVDNFALAGSTTNTSITVDGKGAPIVVFTALPGYLETVEAKLVDGRLPTLADYDSGQRVVVVSESAVQTIFSGRAIGRQVVRAGPDRDPWTVIGVVSDLRHGGPQATPGRPQVYFPPTATAAETRRATMIVVRTDSSVTAMTEPLRRSAHAVGPRVLVERIRSGDDWFGDRVLTPRQRTVMLGLLGGLGLLLAIVGVFGMTAYAVARRTREIGVRMAFGARPGEMVRHMLRDAVIPVIVGTVIGLAGAAYATAIIASFLFETQPVDVVTFAIVAVVLLLSGFTAALIPSARAARVDPVTALRVE
jgi:putative ABC transport system permease protein